jgi:GNAT superfamily N-acetyltransferase
MSEPRIKIHIRLAERSDVQNIIALHAEDEIGAHGDSNDAALLPAYHSAFEAIANSANEDLYVAEIAGQIVGTFKTAVLTKLTGRGSQILIIQSVQTKADIRGQGIGARMIGFCIDEAKARGIKSVQLMSNAKRIDAHRFYQRLGFVPSHTGFHLALNSAD